MEGTWLCVLCLKMGLKGSLFLGIDFKDSK